MKYADAREHIKDGDLLLAGGAEWFSSAIKRWSGSPYSHVGLALWMRWGKQSRDRLCIFEAMDEGIGVRLYPMSECLAESGVTWHWRSLDETCISADEFLGHAFELWGKPFHKKWHLLCILFPRLLRAVRFWRPMFGVGDSYCHCAKTLSLAYERCGGTLPKEPFLMLPSDVAALPCFAGPVYELVL